VILRRQWHVFDTIKDYADTGAGKTEVINPVRAIDGGLHHQMIKQIDLHPFYVYPSDTRELPGSCFKDLIVRRMR
jgi:hypothetical protein